MKTEHDERKALEERVNEFPATFASKTDVTDIKRLVERIEDKLDRVIERRYGGPN